MGFKVTEEVWGTSVSTPWKINNDPVSMLGL